MNAAPATAGAVAPDRRIALVTGALGTIGRDVVRALRSDGALVIAADASPGAQQLGAQWRVDDPVRLDVTNRASIDALVRFIEGRWGPVDTLVNVAGVVSFGPAATLAEDEWDRVLAVNLKGTLLAIQAVLPGMKSQRFGRIVNIGSVVGKNAGNARPWLDANEQQRAGNVAYGVSKAGIHAMTGFIAKEVAAHGITVNAVAPGPVATAMTANFPGELKALIPVGRVGTASDVSRAVQFLVAPHSDFITGEVLDVNGGLFCD